MARLLGRLAAAILRNPKVFIWPQFIVFLGCVVYTVLFLKTDMNRDNLVGPNQKYHQFYLALKHRRNVKLHAGYMLATPLILFESPFSRVIDAHLPWLNVIGSEGPQALLDTILEG